MPKASLLRFTAIFGALAWAIGILGYAIAKETPLGHIEGTAISSSTKKPISGVSVILTAARKGESELSFTTKTDAQGRFRFVNIPVGKYDVRVLANIHASRPMEIEIDEGKTKRLNLELVPQPPFLNLYIQQSVWAVGEEPIALLEGSTKGDSVAVSLHKLDNDLLLKEEAHELRTALSRVNDEYDGRHLRIEPYVLATEKKFIRITKRDNEGIYRERIKLGKLDPGIYIADVSADGLLRSHPITVTGIGLVTKDSEDKTLAFAMRLDSGEPVEGVDVSLFDDRELAARGTTDANGLCELSTSSRAGAFQNRFIIAKKGDFAAYVATYHYEGEGGGNLIYIYTDRPVYRSGHTVHYKGVSRQWLEDRYAICQEGPVRVEVRDRRGTLVHSAWRKCDSFGTFNGSFVLPKFAPTGYYTILCQYKGRQHYGSFEVAEYKKPEFSVVVEMPKKRCARGDKIKVKIKAEYYFGAPVAGADAKYTVFRSDYFMPIADDEVFDNGNDFVGDGETVSEGTAKIGPDGRAEIQFVADWESGPGFFGASDQKFTVWVEVTDPSRRTAYGESGIIATQGDVRLGISPEKYISPPNEASRFAITAIDYNGVPQENTDVRVIANFIEWENGRGRYAVVSRKSLKTDARGKAQFSFTPAKPGQYAIWAECRDKKGRTIRAFDYFWAEGFTEIKGYAYPDLTIVLDKKTYNPGENAKALITAGKSGAYILLTVEGKSIFESRVIHLEGKSAIVKIPIRKTYGIAFYVNACYVNQKNISFFSKGARISIEDRKLNISVKPERKKYQPGSHSKWVIKVVDSKGEPVVANLSMGVVDESIYGIREESTESIQDFFYKRQPNNVMTDFSFPRVYLSADKAEKALKAADLIKARLRKKFLDTAFWRADIVTDSNGEAQVAFDLPDNLTTWQATVRGVTLDTQVGETTAKAVVSKNLLVRLEAPRFLIKGDEALITATVHNYLPAPERLKVSIRATKLKVLGPSTRRVIIGPNKVARVEWRAKAERLGTAVLSVSAAGKRESDAMEIEVPVNPPGHKKYSVKSGTASKSKIERINISDKAVPGTATVRIRLSPSIVSEVLGSLGYLATYPYGCTEQTISAFIPDVVLWRTMKKLGLPVQGLMENLPDMVSKGLNRIYDLQSYPGSWGWCAYGPQNQWMTAYAVYALMIAKEAGFPVNEQVLKSGIEALKSSQQYENPTTEESVFAAYVLSLAGAKKQSEEFLQTALKSKLAAKETAFAALALHNLGKTEEARRLAEQLLASARRSGSLMFWQGKANFSAAESTAAALMAAQTVIPGDERIPNIVNGLIAQRQFDRWQSTRDTAFAIYALSMQLSDSSPGQNGYAVSVHFNGVPVKDVFFEKSSVFEPEKLVNIPRNLIKKGANVIEFKIKGGGSLRYAVETTQNVVSSKGKKDSSGSTGIQIKREYRKLSPGYDSSLGSSRLRAASSASYMFRSGNVLVCRLTIISPKEYKYVILEDYLPAGFEAADRGRLESWEWTFWWVDRDVRDDRVSFYIETLPKGKKVIEYEVRAIVPGTYKALAPTVQGMYDPKIAAFGKESKISIK